jgi:predicted RNase H-like nuclease (RuvC/YqgF family)
VAEVIQSESEEEDTTEEVEASEELAEDDDDRKETADVGDWEGMEKRIQNLEDAVADLKRDKEGGDDEVEEMTEEVTEPSTNPKTITTKEVVEFSAEDELEILKAENEKLKMDLAKTPAEAPINTNKFSSQVWTPTKEELKKMSKQERILYNLQK